MNIVEQLKVDEGYRSKPYLCTEGYWTIGYGRNLETNPFNIYEARTLLADITPKVTVDPFVAVEQKRNFEEHPLTKEEASELLIADVSRVFYTLRDMQLIPFSSEVMTLKSREGVLVNMAFQLGVSGLLKFKKALKAYTENDYRTCAEELLDSRWAVQTPNRAKRMADQMISGEWQCC